MDGISLGIKQVSNSISLMQDDIKHLINDYGGKSLFGVALAASIISRMRL
jgi:hypothetical protein